MIGDLIKELIEIVKGYTPDLSFGYLERLVPLLDIREDYLVRTDRSVSRIYSIKPRAVSLLTAEQRKRLEDTLRAFAEKGYQLSFFSLVKKGNRDFDRHVGIYRGKGIFEKEAQFRRADFEGSLQREFYVAVTGKSLEHLSQIDVSEIPFRIEKQLSGDEIFSLYRKVFRSEGTFSLEKAVLSSLETNGYASVRELIFPADLQLLDDGLKIGRYYCIPLEVSALSKVSPLEMFRLLSAVDEGFFSLSISYVSKVELERIISRKIKETKGFGYSNTALKQKRYLENLISDLKLSEYKMPVVRYSFRVLVFGDSLEKAKTDAVKLKTKLEALGLPVYEEIDYAKALAESLPAMAFPKKMAFYSDAVTVLPSYVRFIGYPRPVLVFNQDRDVIYFDPIDPQAQSWGIGIFGPTGSGKSNVANAILKSLHALGAWIAVMDIGDSYRELCSFAGGTYVKIDLDGSIRINPFQFRFGFDSVPDSQIEFAVKVLSTLSGHSFSAEEVSLLKRYLKSLYRYRLNPEKNLHWREYLKLLSEGYTPETEKEAYQHFTRAMPTISGFLTGYDYFLKKLETKEKEIGENLKIKIKGIAETKLFNGYTNFSLTSDFTVFELKSLQDYPRYLEAFYLILQRAINDEVYYTEPSTAPESLRSFYGEKELIKRWKRYKVFLTDEFHFVKNSRDIVEDTAFMYRTGRKKNLVRIVISQFLTDLAVFGEDILEGVIENMAVIFLAPHRKESETGDLVKGYEQAISSSAKILHLSPEELQEFQSIRRGQDYAEYYLVSRDRGRTAVRYRNTPLERWIYATYSRDVVIRDTLIRKFGREKAYTLLLEKSREELEKIVEEITDA